MDQNNTSLTSDNPGLENIKECPKSIDDDSPHQSSGDSLFNGDSPIDQHTEDQTLDKDPDNLFDADSIENKDKKEKGPLVNKHLPKKDDESEIYSKILETTFSNLKRFEGLNKSMTMLLPKNIDVDFNLFDETSYELLDLEKENITSKIKLRAKIQNKIRWRLNSLLKIECNSKMVEWDDGTRSLIIGNEYYDLVERDLKDASSMLFYEKSDGIKDLIKIGKVEKEISLIPIVTSTNMAEKLIMENIDRKRKKSLKDNIILDSKEDPEKIRRIELENERAKMKLQRKIEKNQQKRRRSSHKNKYDEEDKYEPGLTTEFLENEE